MSVSIFTVFEITVAKDVVPGGNGPQGHLAEGKKWLMNAETGMAPT